jgi:hypothetical protein
MGLATPRLLIQGYIPRMPGVQVVYPVGGVTQGGASAGGRSLVVAAAGGTRLGGSVGVSRGTAIVASGGVAQGGSISRRKRVYDVYINSGQGDPINYAAPVASGTELTWTSPVLSVPGHFKLGVRALDPLVGLEEQNVDAMVELVLDGSGNDITRVPLAPLGLRAFSLAGGILRVEWSCQGLGVSRQPIAYHLYLGTGLLPDYSRPVATVLRSSQSLGTFSADLSGLSVGVRYSIGVRAYNSVGEESNTIVLYVTADGDPPAVVDSLQAVATNEES